MRSRNLLFGQSLLCTEFDLKGLTEYGQGSKPCDAVQAWLDVEECRSQPPPFLIGGAPAIDLVGPLANQGIDRFETVGRLQTPPQRPEHPQPMQRQGLLQPLVETAHRRFVQPREFLPQPEQGSLRQGIGRLLIRGLEPPTPCRLLGRGQVGHDILPLMPLSAAPALGRRRRSG